MPVYIDKQRGRPDFFWDNNRLLRPLSEVRYHQGRLSGRLEAMHASLRREASLAMLTLEVVRSGELDGELLHSGQVLSFLAARLGLDIANPVPTGIDAASAAGMILDVLTGYDQPLTEKRLTGWHISITPAKRGRMNRLVHYHRPGTHASPARLGTFLRWFNGDVEIDPVIKAGVAHWWFMTMHPFDANNGRIARAITDLQLARSDNSGYRYSSLSDIICSEREVYTRFFTADATDIHAAGSPDLTPFLEWFLHCLFRSLTSSDAHLSAVFRKASFHDAHGTFEFNERQRLVLARLLDGSETRITSSHWARLTATSSDTAVRDINDLVAKGILKKEAAGGRSTSYVLSVG